MEENDKIYYVTAERTLNAGALVREVPELQATHVLITKKEYHGLQKALRIVRDRAMQQVEKSETDGYGYQLLRAEYRPYLGTSYDAWLVTRRTPYSCRMGISEASWMIARDLKDFYDVKIKKGGLSTLDLLPSDKSTYAVGELARMSMDFSRGVYDVAYWTTQLH